MFQLTKPQKEIQKAAKDFAKGEFDKELAYELDRDGVFPEEIWKSAADLGFIGIHFPEKYSGGGMGLLENALISEELCRKDPSIGSAIVQAPIGCELLCQFGSDKQKESYLPKVAEGELLSAKALAETRSGGDYTDVQTNADHLSAQWKLSGKKAYVINGGKAGFYIVTCKTGAEADPIEKCLTMFLIDAGNPGLISKPYGKRLGNNLVACSEMTFEDVLLEEDNILGKAGQGYFQLMTYLNQERLNLAGQALGNALASYDRMIDYVKGREQFGRKIAEFQVSKHKIAEMATRIELSRLILHKAAWLADNNKTDPALCSMAKMTACRTAMEVGAHTIQLFGGYGYMTEYEVERFYRDAKTLEIREGARDIQNEVIAEAAIGKIK